jgi:hypothetical protein
MFHTYVEHFIWMLHLFTIVLSVFEVFLQVFQKHVSSVLFAFRRMLQPLHLDVSKVDRMLYMGCIWEAGGAVSVWCKRCRGGAGLRVGAQNAGVGGTC